MTVSLTDKQQEQLLALLNFNPEAIDEQTTFESIADIANAQCSTYDWFNTYRLYYLQQDILAILNDIYDNVSETYDGDELIALTNAIAEDLEDNDQLGSERMATLYELVETYTQP